MGVFLIIEIRYKVSKLLFLYYGGKEKVVSIYWVEKFYGYFI